MMKMTPFQLSFLISCGMSAAMGAQPNIIYIQADSMDGRLLDPTSPYWWKLSMPNLRKLAENGVNFARTYTASPQCVPSRTAMVTSKYVHETRTWNNGMGIARSASTGLLDTQCVSVWNSSTCARMAGLQTAANWTLFEAMEAAGYNLTVVNRLDIGNGLMDEFVNGTGNGFHTGPSLAILARSADIRKATDVNPSTEVNDNNTDPYSHDTVAEGDTVAWLQSHNPVQPHPWMLWFGILDPHPPYDTNSTYLSSVNESAVDVPVWQGRDYMHPGDSFLSIAKNVWGPYSDMEVKSVRRSYWGAVAQADALMGRVLDAAAATGHLDNTVVMFTSDHGEMGMEHRQDLKNSLYEPSTRVPLIIAAYGSAKDSTGIPAGLVVTNITSHLDLVPTMLELAGGTQLPGSRGYSLAPFFDMEGLSAPFPRPYAAFEYHSNLGNTGSFGLRQGQWKYITWGRTLFPWFGTNYTDQLFDVESDPFELHDVASSNPTVVASMAATLQAEWGGRDPQDIDKEAKLNDIVQYNAWFGPSAMDPATRRAHFVNTFQGFDDADMQRVKAWEALGRAAVV